LHNRTGKKNGFATGISHWKRKARNTEQTLAFPSRAKSFEQRRLHRCGLLCALHAGACFRLGATTTTIWRFSSAAAPQTIFPPSTPSFDPQKKKPFRFSLLPLFGWPHHSFLSSASLLFPSRRGNPLLWHRLLMVPGGVSNIERKKSLRAGFCRTLKQRNRTIRFGTNSDR
jgi:hypothetical protein